MGWDISDIDKTVMQIIILLVKREELFDIKKKQFISWLKLKGRTLHLQCTVNNKNEIEVKSLNRNEKKLFHVHDSKISDDPSLNRPLICRTIY